MEKTAANVVAPSSVYRSRHGKVPVTHLPGGTSLSLSSLLFLSAPRCSVGEASVTHVHIALYERRRGRERRRPRICTWDCVSPRTAVTEWWCPPPPLCPDKSAVLCAKVGSLPRVRHLWPFRRGDARGTQSPCVTLRMRRWYIDYAYFSPAIKNSIDGRGWRFCNCGKDRRSEWEKKKKKKLLSQYAIISAVDYDRRHEYSCTAAERILKSANRVYSACDLFYARDYISSAEQRSVCDYRKIVVHIKY